MNPENPEILSDAYEAFHNHLDECQQCREHPFALCQTGAQRLIDAARSSSKIMTPEAMLTAIAESEGLILPRIILKRIPNYPEDLNAILPLLPPETRIRIFTGPFYSIDYHGLEVQGKCLALAACEFYLKWKGKWLE